MIVDRPEWHERAACCGMTVSLNAERRECRWTRHQLTDSWRTAFRLIALAAHHQPFTVPVLITAQVYQSRNILQDPGNAYPSIKAAIDGIRDAGLLADDTGAHIAGIMLLAPLRGPDALTITIDEVPES